MTIVTDDLFRTYHENDALGLAALVRKGEVTAAELVETALTVIERENPKLNAVIHRLDDMARAQVASGLPSGAPFAGVPFLLKELASMWQGTPLTNSCAWMRGLRAPADSEATRRIKAAGFVLVGKSNAPENGWAITTEPRLYGPTRNPWRDDVTPGGSSGGSAAAVAAGLVPLAEASDGAGSIRVPASCCGVVGLKPSRGRVTLAPFGDYLVRRGLLPLRLAHGSRHCRLPRRARGSAAGRSVHPTDTRHVVSRSRGPRAVAAARRLHGHPPGRQPA